MQPQGVELEVDKMKTQLVEGGALLTGCGACVGPGIEGGWNHETGGW